MALPSLLMAGEQELFKNGTMNRETLIANILKKRSYLCVGLDSDVEKLPTHFAQRPDGVLAFNKQIIDATKDLCVSYKINTAFYEAMGAEGWDVMASTIKYIGKEHFIIADAKRGDIGNTSHQYAKAFFKQLDADAVTVAPYMGKDSVLPFLDYAGKWAIVLGLTSNAGAEDFELQKMEAGALYESVLQKVSSWGTLENLMFVIGATQSDEFISIRKICPKHFFLVPGVGSQGGSLQQISEKALTAEVGLLINVSRAIIFASQGADFAQRAQEVAQNYQQEMEQYLRDKGLI